MALTSNEKWQGGFVVDTSVNPPTRVVTTSLTGARWWGGFLRDPDGRLVVTYA